MMHRIRQEGGLPAGGEDQSGRRQLLLAGIISWEGDPRKVPTHSHDWIEESSPKLCVHVSSPNDMTDLTRQHPSKIKVGIQPHL